MVLTHCVVEGVAVMLAPLGANSGSSSYNSSTLGFNRMTAPTGGAGPSDVEDFDDLCRAQLAHAALLAQGVVNNVESLCLQREHGMMGGLELVLLKLERRGGDLEWEQGGFGLAWLWLVG